MKLPTLKNIKVAAGADGMDRTIRWVYIAECFEDNREVVDWLYGGELVFITGRNIRGDEDILLDLIRKIYDRKVSGLMINIGPYISGIPEKAVKLADELGFPIFTIPWEIRLVDITRELCEAIITKEMEEKSIDNLLENILYGEVPEDESLPDRAAYYGYDLSGQCMMAVADIYHFVEYLKQREIRDEESILQLKANFKRVVSEILVRNNRKPLIMLRSDSVYMLFKAQANDGDVLNTIASQIKQDVWKKLEGMSIHMGVGNAYSKLSDMRKSLKEAEQAIKTARFMPQDREYAHYRDLGLYSLLFGIKDQQLLESYSREALGKLEEYDRINDSELVGTLEMFLNENGNITTTAEKMFLHRNTLKYRLNKIEEISGSNLREIRELMKLEIGLMIRRYLRELP